MNRLVELATIACFCVIVAAGRLAAATTLTTLYSFGPLPGSDGYNPYGGLVEGSDGNFYGTAYLGGAGLNGTVFRISPSGTFTNLHTFHGTFAGGDGSHPYATLVFGSDGYLYGTTIGGGTDGDGTVFRISTTGDFTTLHSFGAGEGSQPYGGLVEKDGYLYGTTFAGATVFKISLPGALTTLHSFDDGFGPYAGLVLASDGKFYGTTAQPGMVGGTVFRIGPDGDFTSLHSFTGSDGDSPEAPLIQGSDGELYGTTLFGGANLAGSIFRIGLSGTFMNLHSFDGSDGYGPSAALVLATDGNLYGTTYGGGNLFGMGPGADVNPECDDTCGTVFRVDPSGQVTVVYSFGGSDGADPYGALVQGSDGSFYGTTRDGGAYNLGTVFKLTIDEAPTTTPLPPSVPPSCPAGTPSACDDGDACTDEPCAAPCEHVERSRATPDGIVCRVGNMRAILDEPPTPACERRCPRGLAGRFDKVIQLSDRARTASSTKKCTRALKAAARNAKALDRLIARLVGKGRIVPPSRADRIGAQSRMLVDGYATLVTSDFCTKQ